MCYYMLYNVFLSLKCLTTSTTIPYFRQAAAAAAVLFALSAVPTAASEAELSFIHTPPRPVPWRGGPVLQKDCIHMSGNYLENSCVET